MLTVNQLSGFGGADLGVPQFIASIQTFGSINGTKAIDLSSLGLRDGDILIIAAANDYSFDATPFVVTPGYTQIVSIQSGADRGFAAYYFIVSGSAPSTVTVTSGPFNYAINIASYRYVSRSNPIHAAAAAIADTTSSPNPPSVTTTISNTLVVAFGAQEDGLSTAGATPTGYLTNGHSHESSGSGQSTVAMASKLLRDPAIENPGNFVFNGFGPSYAYTIALGPL